MNEQPNVIHVLSIEDNPADRTLIRELLSQATRLGWGLPHFDVTCVSRMADALDTLNSDAPIDVILTDLDLPDSRSDATFVTLREAAPALPIIVLTSRNDVELARKTVRAGAEDYLFKREMSGSLLAHTMIYAIERKQLHNALEQRVEARTTELRETNKELRQVNEALEAEITEHKQTERALLEQTAALQESEARERARREELRTIMDTVPAVIWIAHDATGQQITGNRAAYRLLRMDEDQNMSVTPADGPAPPHFRLIHDGVEVSPDELPMQRACAKGEKTMNYEGDIVFDDGTRRTMFGNIVPLKDGEGKVRGAVAAYVDITERKKAMENLKEGEARYRRLVEHMYDLVYRYEMAPERGFTYVSPSVARITGYTPEEHYTDPDLGLKLVHPEDRPVLEETMSGSGEIPQPLMLRWITKNGHVIWTEQRIIPTYDETGNLVALEGVARDITERKQTEEALRRSERRRRQAQQLARMGYWDWDVATETLHWSPEVFDIFGQDPQHFTPTAERFEALIHPEDREAFLEQRSQMLEAEGYASIEHRIVLPDGSTRHVLELAEVHREAQGEVVQVSGTVQDITERKRTEEALSESEALLKRSQVMAHVGSWVFDAATEQLRWSEETYRIFGVRRSDFDPTYERFLVSVHPDDRAAVDAEFSESLKRGVEECEIEHRIIRRDTGEIRWVHEKCEHVRDGAGALLRSVGMVQDITERRRAEEALREAHQCLEAFFEHSPRLAGIFDREGRYRMANPATAQALGRTPEDIAGQTFRELLSPEVAETFMNRIDRMVESQGPLAVDDQIVIGDEERIFETILFPLSWEGETPLTFGFMASDVTERKRAERELARYAAELKRSNRELEQLGYVLSHDLQEPARTVKGYLDLLARRCRGQLDSQTDTYIAHAMDGAERMQEMIRALLDLSRIETRGHTFAPVDVEALVERTLTMLQPTLEATAATVTYDALPTVQADPAQLAQVFQNLITNALKFRREGVAPQVEISADRKDGAWHFSVADNGIGVDPKQADHVFQIFQRLHTREEYPGTGIGLALCQKIVERHGGRIWVESEPGEGATFRFALPVTKTHKVDD